ncbi:MAG: ASKHA domain-containing protein [Planctomycetota bacterium]|jgi:uncharacterized 2Fe-2S/4Fe-4S cluster protein (DUF4445 family)
MAEKKKNTLVTFEGTGKSARISRDETLLDAARRAGVYLTSFCGGQGVCGRCRVRLAEGKVTGEAPPDILKKKLAEGELLACLSNPDNDEITVQVPIESHLGAGKILLDEDTFADGHEDLGSNLPERFPLTPVSRKIYLELEPPTLQNNLDDYARVTKALDDKGFRIFAVQFDVVQQIRSILRERDYKITVTLCRTGRNGWVLSRIEPGDTSDKHFGIAVDVGTTTIVVNLLNLVTGATMGAAARYNSQFIQNYGEDYIARIMYAEENDALKDLQRAVVGDIAVLTRELAARYGVIEQDINAVLCTGNTAMMHFLLGIDPGGIRRDPYIPAINTIPSQRIEDIGLPGAAHARLYLMPGVSAYVGSDISSGAIAIGLDKSEELTLFIDIGTNGEIVVGSKDIPPVCCSASAGPAFEGSGVKYGMRAAEGAIESFSISSGGEVGYKVIGDVKPRGICGTGLVEVLAELFRAGILGANAKFVQDTKNSCLRGCDIECEYVLVPASESAMGEDIVLTQADVDNLIRSKAAIYAGTATLMSQLGLEMSAIKQLYIAGGFGNYLDIDSAIAIGMLPNLPPDRIHFVGNTSLSGAKMALLSNEACDAIRDIASNMTYVDLMRNPMFMEEFMLANYLPHTEVERFSDAAAG